tara:strand:+ start:399 stop:572 length:174 start_codon:yes stop_codon:yes gene_type:complete
MKLKNKKLNIMFDRTDEIIREMNERTDIAIRKMRNKIIIIYSIKAIILSVITYILMN